jgi:hypothetical protein
MTYYLRKVSFSKWEPNKGKIASDYSADAITGCTRTSGNTLSVWSSEKMDFDSPECKNLIVAMASTMTRPDLIDLVWFENSWLNENEIKIDKTPGQSKCSLVNPHHRDIIELTHANLALVGEHIIDRMQTENAFKRISKKKLIALVANKITCEKLVSIEDLSEKWQKEIEKYNLENCNNPPSTP